MEIVWDLARLREMDHLCPPRPASSVGVEATTAIYGSLFK